MRGSAEADARYWTQRVKPGRTQTAGQLPTLAALAWSFVARVPHLHRLASCLLTAASTPKVKSVVLPSGWFSDSLPAMESKKTKQSISESNERRQHMHNLAKDPARSPRERSSALNLVESTPAFVHEEGLYVNASSPDYFQGSHRKGARRDEIRKDPKITNDDANRT